MIALARLQNVTKWPCNSFPVLLTDYSPRWSETLHVTSHHPSKVHFTFIHNSSCYISWNFTSDYGIKRLTEYGWYAYSAMRLKHLPILKSFLQNACCLMRCLLCCEGIVDMMGCNKNSTVNVNCLAFKSFRYIKTPHCVHSMHTLQPPYKASSFQCRRRCSNFAVVHRPCMPVMVSN